MFSQDIFDPIFRKRTVRSCCVNIPIAHTGKSIYYFANDRGLRISLHRPDINYITDADILYANMMHPSVAGPSHN